MSRLYLMIALVCCVNGCTRLRFIVDTMPAEEKLTETSVDLMGAGAAGNDKIALIDVTGLIIDAPRFGILAPGENMVARFSESLAMAAADGAVKAVIIRINSPGGTVTSSDVMYREVMHFKQATKKPVVIQMADVAASGGYYLACAGDEIIAFPTTVTGSIGVIIQTFNFSDGMRRIGIRADAITSGPNKAMGSPFEPMPPEHRELLQGLVDQFYANFKSIVVESRPHLSENDLQWITDGRVVTGTEAAQTGLVDATGDLRDAFAAAKRRANLATARLIKYHRPQEYVGSPYAAAPTPATTASQINLLQLNLEGGPMFDSPGFWYLWDPTVW
jgi:protease-4